MADIAGFLDVLCCPSCGGGLGIDDRALSCAEGHRFEHLPGAAGADPIADLATDVVQETTPGQVAMRLRPLARVYERVWRPMFTAVTGGRDPDRETAELAEWLDDLGLATDGTVLDVCCGPGNTTRRIATAVPRGRVLGVDLSVPMLEQAAREHGGEAGGAKVAYARADAHRLPLDDACIDAAHCAAALYLVSDPGAVIAEIARVTRPRGAFVGMTLVPLVPGPRPISAALTGMRHVSAGELRDHCERAGFVDVEIERRGAALLFRARRA